MNYVTGAAVRNLREKRGLTQKQLADELHVSDKTISKWETGRGLPDIGILSELAQTLNISVAELLAGECIENENRAGNMRKTAFYVCPICGNIIRAVGKGAFSCCGVLLPQLEAEEPDADHTLNVEEMDGEFYVSMNHEMTKTHYISFFAYITGDRTELVKLYPEQNAETRFSRRGHGTMVAYCNRHGLYKVRV